MASTRASMRASRDLALPLLLGIDPTRPDHVAAERTPPHPKDCCKEMQ